MSSDSGQDGDRSSAVRAWVDSTAGDSTTAATAGPITGLPIRIRVRAAQAGDIDPERDADESSVESPTTASRAGSVETRPTEVDTSDGVANDDQNNDDGDTLSQVSSHRSRQSAGQVEAGEPLRACLSSHPHPRMSSSHTAMFPAHIVAALTLQQAISRETARHVSRDILLRRLGATVRVSFADSLSTLV